MSEATPSKITAERIRELFDYNPDTGELTRKNDGSLVQGRTLKVDGEGHATSRYIWLHYYGEWPPLDKLVDHENRMKRDHRIKNLRLADYSQNAFNMNYPNSSGYKGVTYDYGRPAKPWRAQIRIDGKKTNLGRFETKEEAAEAYRQIALELGGEFACLE